MITINKTFRIFVLGIILSFIYSKSFSLSLITVFEGFALAIFLAWFISKLDLKSRDAFAVVWLGLFAVGMFNNMLEAYFFTKMYPSVGAFLAALTAPFFITFLESAAAIFLLGGGRSSDLAGALKVHLGSRTAVSWIKRMFASSVLYMPTYFLFGIMVSSFVMPYYLKSPGLVVPPVLTIVILQIAKGVIYAFVLLIVFAAVGKERKTNFIVASALLYIPGAALPLISSMASSNVISQVAPYHIVELFADSVVYAYAVSRLISAR